MRREIVGVLSALVLVVSLGLAVVQTAIPVQAASSGPNDGLTAADDSSIGQIAWSDPSKALTQDNIYATASLGQKQVSRYLKVTNFGFAIPSGATIKGILVEVDRYASTEGGTDNSRVNDNSIRLVKGGVISGNEKSTGLLWPASDTDTYQSYGGSTDLWELTWTPADINGSGFGVVISAEKDNSNNTRIAYVDHIRITVYYNSPPVANDQSVSTDEDIAIAITLTASDAENDPLTYSIATQPSHGTLGGTPPDVTYTPSANYNGSDSFTFKANDGMDDSNTATVSITINPVNDAPTDIALSNSSVAENEPVNTVVGTLSTTDPDTDDTFTYALVSGTGATDNGSFNILDSSLRTLESFDYETKNSYSIRVRSTDQGELWVEKQFTITVTNVNYDLTMAADPEVGGTATDLTNESPYAEGTVVSIKAEANEGYGFVNWTAPAGGFDDASAAETTFTMPAQNVTVTANFEVAYDLTMAADPEVGGTATDLTNESPYAEGTEVSIKADASEGYEFVNWTAPAGVFGNATAAETIFTMPAQNVTVTANFEEVLPPPVYPTVTTQAATDITTDSATLNINYTLGNYTSVDVRFAYKKSADSAWSYTAWVSKTADGTHAESLTGLDSNTTYDFKAQLKYNGTVIESANHQFTTDTPSTPPPSGGGCFIATAAYGTPTAEQIDVLREFRDVVLLESTAGSQFVFLYYQLSPPVAEFIAGNELLRTLVRELLVDPIVWVVEATGDIWLN